MVKVANGPADPKGEEMGRHQNKENKDLEIHLSTPGFAALRRRAEARRGVWWARPDRRRSPLSGSPRHRSSAAARRAGGVERAAPVAAFDRPCARNTWARPIRCSAEALSGRTRAARRNACRRRGSDERSSLPRGERCGREAGGALRALLADAPDEWWKRRVVACAIDSRCRRSFVLPSEILGFLK